MASSNGDGNDRGSMWDLDQKLDQPMDEEAGRLKNLYREKVEIKFIFFVFCLCIWSQRFFQSEIQMVL